MILIQKILLFVSSTTDFGLKEKVCDQFFDSDLLWPDVSNKSDTIRLCQNVENQPVKFATLCKIY